CDDIVSNQNDDGSFEVSKPICEEIDVPPAIEEELLDCTDKCIVDNITKKVEKDHKKEVAIAVVQDEAFPDKHKEVVSKQKDDGSIEIDDSIRKESHAPKEEINTTNIDKRYVTQKYTFTADGK
ncbi:4740_t:CDS:2, partial [Cetraspora pellucida]